MSCEWCHTTLYGNGTVFKIHCWPTEFLRVHDEVCADEVLSNLVLDESSVHWLRIDQDGKRHVGRTREFQASDQRVGVCLDKTWNPILQSAWCASFHVATFEESYFAKSIGHRLIFGWRGRVLTLELLHECWEDTRNQIMMWIESHGLQDTAWYVVCEDSYSISRDCFGLEKEDLYQACLPGENSNIVLCKSKEALAKKINKRFIEDGDLQCDLKWYPTQPMLNHLGAQINKKRKKMEVLENALIKLEKVVVVHH